jgi:SAM-dependent methyltransferase
MKWFEKNYSSKVNKDKIKILDVGSYDVNGSYKDIFSDKKYEYVGMDMEKGPNVDIVLANPYDWSEIETDSYDVIISGQTFEHTEFFWITMAEMVRSLKKDGLLCIIAPSNIIEHRYPVDCYRFYSDGMVALARYTNLELLHVHTNSAPNSNKKWYSQTNVDTILIARKPYSGQTKYVDLKTYKCVPANLEVLRDGLIPYKTKREIIENFLRKILPKKVRVLIRKIIK